MSNLTIEALELVICTATHPPLWYAISEHLEEKAVYQMEIGTPSEWWLFSREAFAEIAAEVSQYREFRHIATRK